MKNKLIKIGSIICVVIVLLTLIVIPTSAVESDLILDAPNPLVFDEVLNQNYLSYNVDGSSYIDIECDFYLDKDPYRLVCDAIRVIVDSEDGNLEVRYDGVIYYNGVAAGERLTYSVYDNDHWLVENYADSPVPFTVDDMRTLYFENDTSLNVSFANNIDFVPFWLESNSNFVYGQSIPEPEPPHYDAVYHNLNFDFNNLGVDTVVTMFPGPHSFNLYYNGAVENSLITNDILREYETRIKYDTGGLAYVQLYITSPYSALYINDQIFYGTENMTLLGSVETDSIVVTHRQTQTPTDSTWYYLLNIYLIPYTSVDEIFQAGYDAGFEAGGQYTYGIAYHDGYDNGYRDATKDTDLGGIIDSTLKAPINGLRSFILFDGVSLWDVLSAFICLFLLIAFLKLFAGG